MDCAVVPLKKYKNISLIQTVDFFYPLVDDPHAMGKIAFANVVSDVYAVGVTDLDKLNLIITAPEELKEEERNIIMPMIATGFQESAKLAGCKVHVQNIHVNPWCIIGGIATAVVKKDEVIMPHNAKDGDHLILTKPLGTQLATNAYLWLKERNDKYLMLAEQFTDDDIKETYQTAVNTMAYLNKTAAQLMHKYKANAATDVTGFGLLGHAQNLAEFQKGCLKFIINKIPVFKNILSFGKILNQDVKLRAGKSVETSGGLLISIPSEYSNQFCQEFNNITNGEQLAWIVGYVKKSDKREAILCEETDIFEIDFSNS
ncbi:selenide, water dikinase 2 isoform X3 [Lucilia cuprina]|nr:selenide, water dikinase 2 isoform X3 [Lucilia cuprina]